MKFNVIIWFCFMLIILKKWENFQVRHLVCVLNINIIA